MKAPPSACWFTVTVAVVPVVLGDGKIHRQEKSDDRDGNGHE